MEHDDQYESWKKDRANVEPPADFADRVMASIHRSRRRAWLVFLGRLLRVAARSRIVRAAICSLAVAVWALRIGIALVVFIPR